MSAHTPGPWKFEPRQIAATHEITFGKGKNRPMCIVGYAYKGRGLEEAEANARLIAAAPELLGALEALWDADSEDFDAMEAGWALAKSAIAKARGSK